MKKIVRLTESKLVEMIRDIVSEQQTNKTPPPVPKVTTTKFMPPEIKPDEEVTKPEPGPETYEEAKELNAYNQRLLVLKNNGTISPEGFMNEYNRKNPSRPIKTPNDKIIPYITTDKFIPPAMSKEPEVTKPEPAELEPLQESIRRTINMFKRIK